jgi:hypothetical protein
VRARGSTAEAGLPVRAAQTLRPSPSPQHHRNAVGLMARSVPAITAWRRDRRQRIEVEFAPALRPGPGRPYARPGSVNGCIEAHGTASKNLMRFGIESCL